FRARRRRRADFWPLLQLHELHYRLHGGSACLHGRGARRHRQYSGRHAGWAPHRTHRIPRRPVSRRALDRPDHLFDPGAGARVPADWAARARGAHEILTAAAMATLLSKRARGLVAPLTERIGPVATRRMGLAIIMLAALVFPLLNGNEGNIDAAAHPLAFATLALRLNIVVGFAGLLDLGYAAFFAIGAYTYGIFASYQVQPEWSALWEPLQFLGLVERLSPGGGPDHVHFTVSFWLMLPVSALVAAFFGVLFGAPTLRLKGDYLAIVTLGFGEIVPIVARNTPSLTNGAAGLNGVATPNLFGYGFGVKSMPYYYLGLALIVFLIFVSARLKSSRIGRAWMAIREDEIAAEA